MRNHLHLARAGSEACRGPVLRGRHWTLPLALALTLLVLLLLLMLMLR